MIRSIWGRTGSGIRLTTAEITASSFPHCSGHNTSTAAPSTSLAAVTLTVAGAWAVLLEHAAIRHAPITSQRRFISDRTIPDRQRRGPRNDGCARGPPSLRGAAPLAWRLGRACHSSELSRDLTA